MAQQSPNIFAALEKAKEQNPPKSKKQNKPQQQPQQQKKPAQAQQPQQKPKQQPQQQQQNKQQPQQKQPQQKQQPQQQQKQQPQQAAQQAPQPQAHAAPSASSKSINVEFRLQVGGTWYSAEAINKQEDVARACVDYYLQINQPISFNSFNGGFFIDVHGQPWNEQSCSKTTVGYALNWIEVLNKLLSGEDATGQVTVSESRLHLTIDGFLIEMEDPDLQDCSLITVDARGLLPQFLRETKKCAWAFQAMMRVLDSRMKGTPVADRQKLVALETPIKAFASYALTNSGTLSGLWESFDAAKFSGEHSSSQGGVPQGSWAAKSGVAATTTAPPKKQESFSLGSSAWPTLGGAPGKKGGRK